MATGIPLLDMFSGGTPPSLQTSFLDPETQAIVNRRTDAVNNTAEGDISKQYKQAADTSGFLKQSQDDAAIRDKATASQTPDTLTQAIQNKANRAYTTQNNLQNRNFDLQELPERIRRADVARQSQLGVTNVYQQQAARQLQAQQQADSARNSAIGSILGLAGTLGGAAIGGPTGAAVGGQLGSGMMSQPAPAPLPSTNSGYTFSDPNSSVPTGYNSQLLGRVGR